MMSNELEVPCLHAIHEKTLKYHGMVIKKLLFHIGQIANRNPTCFHGIVRALYFWQG